MALYNVDQLIESVKSRAMVSNTNASGTSDESIRRHLNEALQEIIVPFLLRVREEYFVKTELKPINANQSRYPIPPRAIGTKLRDLMVRNTSSNPNRIALARINREMLSQLDGLGTQSNASCFFVEGDHYVLIPTINASPSGNMEISYFFRPGELVTSDYYRVITYVDYTNKTVTVASTPSGWDTTQTYDIHSASGEIRRWNLVASNVLANVFTFSGTTDSAFLPFSLDKDEFRTTVIIGDHLTLKETAAYPSIPEELQNALIQAAVCKLVEAIGDREAWDLHNQRLKDIMEGQLFLVDDRVEGRSQKIIGGTLLRAGRYSGIRTSRSI